MHVGYAALFQNPGNALPDHEVYRQELRLAEMAEPLGFDSVWSVEHHFTNYTMCPDVTQFLSYMAARTERVQLGSMVIVLPWHDPIRVAEEVSLLDHLSGGRAILGIGRGLGRIEFEGLGIPMDESRDRFVEAAEMVIAGLASGYIEHAGRHYTQPRREIRPAPFKSFTKRTYAAAVSPESMPIMARLGVGLLVIPQKPWDDVREDFARYHNAWREHHGPDSAPPAPMCAALYFVDKSRDRAAELAHRYIGDYYRSIMDHYEIGGSHFARTRGYDFYGRVTEHMERHGRDKAIEEFIDLMPWGTPSDVLEKLRFIEETIGNQAFLCHFSFAGMPYEVAEDSMRLFTHEVRPHLAGMVRKE